MNPGFTLVFLEVSEDVTDFDLSEVPSDITASNFVIPEIS